ncbi:hypothetical protein A3H66_03455 [Candidatus Falkowbacteria bacterium RIFCSPLOWO2_02_FULL_45_21]|uniref:Glycosyl transferase family 1 domain-containing protein n=1 Tax=Candidatus Falkowbacteria bacterium RIFCSPLOWO2_02_FULL_45_21 TaxID=1797989 RepID=A0A1F5SAS3_9BACT|nr:MAG: hypothetical protein A3H66_03455 [Candidatus Falkowbacteria bacterium RIFCSPLOWO2_02_FULL_45_21]
MKLLILTQKVDINDDLLGFMHGWIAEFAKRCDQVTVVCLEKGMFDLPPNVRVLSLGKETGKSKIKYLINFYKQIWRQRENYEAVLAHMNAEYMVLGGLIWRLLGKKTGLWYVHRQINLKLRLAEKLADVIFTASPESFKLKSAKLKIIGHGINLDKFKDNRDIGSETNFKIIYVGRISRIKNQQLLIEAINILREKGVVNLKVDFVGRPIYQEDESYRNELINLADKYSLNNYVNFTGSVPNKDIAEVYRRADLSVNLCPTGGLDKAVLESMAMGLPVIVFNKAFAPLLKGSGGLILTDLSAPELADKICALSTAPKEELNLIGRSLRKKIVDQYSLSDLVKKIVNQLGV